LRFVLTDKGRAILAALFRGRPVRLIAQRRD
jgi:hypothetical protein